MGRGKRGKRMEKGRGGEGSPPPHFLLTTLTTVGLCETTLPTNKQYRCTTPRGAFNNSYDENSKTSSFFLLWYI